MKILTLCLSSNFGNFEHLTYVFFGGTGVPIGSPFGSTVAEVFHRHFENCIFDSNSPFIEHTVYVYRYVDDVLCLWKDPTADLVVFLKLLNS